MRLSEVKAGDVLIADDGFTCLHNGDRRTVEQDKRGLFIRCGDGVHYLDGQVDFDDEDLLVGLSRPQEAAPLSRSRKNRRDGMSTRDETIKLRDKWYAEAKKQTPETLPAFLKKLAKHPKDYNTACYATAAAAIAAANAMGDGLTGFQGGAVMWEFMREWNGVEFPARLLKYETMLYPQYEHTYRCINQETWDWLQQEARKRLSGDCGAASRVVKHWRSIAAGKVPFGYAVEAA